MIEEIPRSERKKFDNGVKTVAKNLLAANVEMEVIVKTTGLTAAEIENLPNEDLDDEYFFKSWLFIVPNKLVSIVI